MVFGRQRFDPAGVARLVPLSSFELGDEENFAARTDRLKIAGLVEGAVDGDGGLFLEVVAEVGVKQV